ncbi:MAG TPA: hypothetical protein VFZ76_16815, partial [Anaerolineales bacterium]
PPENGAQLPGFGQGGFTSTELSTSDKHNHRVSGRVVSGSEERCLAQPPGFDKLNHRRTELSPCSSGLRQCH